MFNSYGGQLAAQHASFRSQRDTSRNSGSSGSSSPMAVSPVDVQSLATAYGPLDNYRSEEMLISNTPESDCLRLLKETRARLSSFDSTAELNRRSRKYSFSSATSSSPPGEFEDSDCEGSDVDEISKKKVICFFPVNHDEPLILPQDVVNLILFQYLPVTDIVRFDTALTNTARRRLWLESLHTLKAEVFNNFIYTSLSSLRWVMKKGVDFRNITVHRAGIDSHETLLHYGCRVNMISIVKVLIERSTCEVDFKCARGDTALYVSVDHGHEDAAICLLKAGADGNACNGSQWSPLHRAVLHGYRSIVQLLIAHKARLEARNYNADTPLCVAVQHREFEIIQDLLNAGANVDVQNLSRGESPLHKAVKKSPKSRDFCVDILRLLIEKYKATVTVVDHERCNVLHSAIMADRLLAVQYLLTHLEDSKVTDLLCAKNGDGQSPLGLATAFKRKEIVSYMLMFMRQSKRAVWIENEALTTSMADLVGAEAVKSIKFVFHR